MARPKIYDDSHFAFTRRINPNGTVYVVAYRNEWDPVKKRSRVKQRQQVGVLNTTTGRVTLGKTYLTNHPEMVGKTYIYEDNQLIEVAEADIQKKESTQEVEQTFTDDIISWGATYACTETIRSLDLKKSLQSVFGEEDAARLLLLAVYQYLQPGAARNFEEWAPGVWLPGAEKLTSQRISELLSRVSEQKMTRYFRNRFDLANNRYEQVCPDCSYRFLALDSTAISTYSETIEDAAYGHAKQNPELKQINYTLGIDYMTGDVVYAYESQGSINDKALYPSLLEDMKNNSFALEKTVLVTDRGYARIANIQKLLTEGVNYICGVPLSEKSIRDNLVKFWPSLTSSAFYSRKFKTYARTTEENWSVSTATGEYPQKTWVHYYRDIELSCAQSVHLQDQVEEVLELKRDGKEVAPDLWKATRRFLGESKDCGRHIKTDILDKELKQTGCFVIRSNCISNAFDALLVYRKRNIVETSFRLFKVLNEGNRLYCGNKTYLGKLFVYTLAEAIRFSQMVTMKNNSETSGLAIPAESMETVKLTLSRLRATKSPRSKAWKVKTVHKKARDILALLGINKTPDYLN